MHPLDILAQIGVLQEAPLPYKGIVALGENESRLYPLPEKLGARDLSRLVQFFLPAYSCKLLSVRVETAPNSPARLVLASANFVGFCACGTGQERLFVKVTPKINTKRLLELAIVAQRLPSWSPEVLARSENESTLIEWTLRAFVSATQTLVRVAGIRSTHERISGTLSNRLRGKLLIPQFINNIARARFDLLPCQFSSLQINNPPNRALRWTVRFALRLAMQIPDTASLQAALRTLDRQFGEIPLEKPKISPERLSRNLPPNLKHYSTALDLAGALLRQANISGEPGSASAPHISMDMNELYEAAFSNLSSSIKPKVIKKPSWPLSISNPKSKGQAKTVRLEPDLFLDEDSHGCAVILDTKWKQALTSQAWGGGAFWPDKNMLVKPRTPDLYQVIAYGAEAVRRGNKRRKCIVALIYPCLHQAEYFTHRLEIDNTVICIAMIGWNLSRDVRTMAELVWDTVDSLRILEWSAASDLNPIHVISSTN